MPRAASSIDAVAVWLRDAQRVTVLTGAGISTELRIR
jgi:NAD-dependent SIR2 family protein deacetylase